MPGAFAQAAELAPDVHRLPSEFLDRLLTAFVRRHRSGRHRARGRTSPAQPGRRGRVLRADPDGRRSARRRATPPPPRSCRSSCCGRRSPTSWTRGFATHCRERQRRRAPADGGRPEVRDGDRAGPGRDTWRYHPLLAEMLRCRAGPPARPALTGHPQPFPDPRVIWARRDVASGRTGIGSPRRCQQGHALTADRRSLPGSWILFLPRHPAQCTLSGCGRIAPRT